MGITSHVASMVACVSPRASIAVHPNPRPPPGGMAGIRDRSGPRGTTSASDADLRDGLGVGGNSPTGVASQFHGVAPVPEPSTRAMGGIGLAMRGLGDARRRRQMARA